MGKYGNGKMWAMFKQLSSKYGTVLQQQCSCTTVILFYGGSAESFFKRVHFFCNGKFAPFFDFGHQLRASPVATSYLFNSKKDFMVRREKQFFQSSPRFICPLCTAHNELQQGVQTRWLPFFRGIAKKKKLSYSVQEPNCEVDVFWLQHPTE